MKTPFVCGVNLAYFLLCVLGTAVEETITCRITERVLPVQRLIN